MKFEWDDEKEAINIAKHGVDFKTAQRVFEGFTITAVDERNDYGEVRQQTLGMIDDVAVLLVVHTDREGVTRLISARPSSRRERRHYEQTIRKTYDR